MGGLWMLFRWINCPRKFCKRLWRSSHSAGAGGLARAHQRTGTDGVGRIPYSDARGGGRRVHAAGGHATELSAGDDHGRGTRSETQSRERAVPRGLDGVGWRCVRQPKAHRRFSRGGSAGIQVLSDSSRHRRPSRWSMSSSCARRCRMSRGPVCRCWCMRSCPGRGSSNAAVGGHERRYHLVAIADPLHPGSAIAI